MSKAHDHIELLDWERRMSRHVEPTPDEDGDSWLLEYTDGEDTEERDDNIERRIFHLSFFGGEE